MSEPKSATLYFTEGSSDKVYKAQLTEDANGWSVKFQYGRRGKPLKGGDKGTGLPYDKALKAYDALVSSKIKKGYTEAVSGMTFTSAEFSDRITDFKPQLLNEVSVEGALRFGDEYLVQVKHDGERRGAQFKNGRAIFANRRGIEVGVQTCVADAFTSLAGIVGEPLALDCEDMGDHLVIFDVTDHFMLKGKTFEERASVLAHLEKTIQENGLGEALFVDVPQPASVLASRIEALREAGAEGVVLRHKDSLYTPGRPNSGGDALKVKFWEDCSVRVTNGRDGKHSVGMEVLNYDGAWTFVGNVTVPQGEKPEAGSIIDVKYLYYHTGGSLFQPIFRGVRTDIPETDCHIGQLKHFTDIEIPFRIDQDPDHDDGPGMP